MSLRPLGIPGSYIVESSVFPDDRGFFREWFRGAELSDAGVDFAAAQANLSRSVSGVVRGLHYSIAPEGQAKVVTCVEGELTDVIVDVRVGSPAFGTVVSVPLAAGNGTSVYLPAGVAHGFCVTSEVASLAYLLSSPYQAAYELGVDPFDAEVAVAWPLAGEPVVSARDAAAPSLAERRASGELPRFDEPR
ncbi:MAG TPA: dTDP-4-dehydrorhamnose 3,5-epimerase [Acidimicrobiales bacterium]|nr:dTDP-4-dehydrorhamnose 3,5-epimerase [Acidimicrobiales bacterium]